MAINLKKSLDELKHFSAFLKNASELDISASELVRYCLPHGTLKESIENLWCADELQPDERQKICKTIHEITQRISANTASAIRAYAEEKNLFVSLITGESWELYEKCSGEKLADVLSNCLFLFFVMYDIRTIPRLFSSDEVGEFEKIYCATKQLLDQKGLDELRKKLPNTVLEMYGQKTRFSGEVSSVFTHKTCLLHVSEASNGEETNNKKCTKNYVAVLEKIIGKIAAHDFDLFEMCELVKSDLTVKFDFSVWKKACHVLPEMQELAEIRVTGEFLKVLKCVACSYNDWGSIMTYFYEEFREVNGNLKTFKPFYQDFDEDLRNLLTYLEDHAQLHVNQIKFEKAVNECAWLLMISPVETLILLFLQCLENVLMVPNFIRILRKLPEYRDTDMEAVFEEDSSTTRKTPILMLALRHILTTERSSIQSNIKRRNFVYLCVALCRERHALSKEGKDEAGDEEDDCSEVSTTHFGDIVDFALVDGSVILNHLVLPAMKQVFYQEIAIEIERKMLTSVGARRTPIMWKAEQGIKSGGEVTVKNDSGVSILELISILLGIINENKDFDDYALFDCCHDCLNLLGERLKEDGAVIEVDAFDNLLTRFDKSLWASRYAVASWFYKCLESYKKEVPLVLYEALKEENRQTLKVVETDVDDNDASARSVLRKLLKLAVINSELTLDLIKGGFSTSVIITGHDVSGALVDILRDLYGFPSNRIDGVVKVIRDIVNQMDLSREIVHLHFFTEISESSFYGLRLIEPLLLIQEAVLCAIHYDKKSTDDLTAVPFSDLEIENQVALRLLKLFCELAKDHIQKEMIDWRRSNIKRKVEIKEPRPIPSGVNINREIRVGTQLIQLYFAAVILANYIIGLPSYLKILLVQLTDFHVEMEKIKLGSSFDGIINKTSLDQVRKTKMISNNQPMEKFCAVSDSELASTDMNSCSQTFAIANSGYEANTKTERTNVTVKTVRDLFDDDLSVKYKQYVVFMAVTRMIKDPAMSTILENRLLQGRRSNGSKCVVGQKQRRAALSSAASKNFHNGDQEKNGGCTWNKNSDDGQINSGGFRRKNKNRK